MAEAADIREGDLVCLPSGAIGVVLQKGIGAAWVEGRDVDDSRFRFTVPYADLTRVSRTSET